MRYKNLPDIPSVRTIFWSVVMLAVVAVSIIHACSRQSIKPPMEKLPHTIETGNWAGYGIYGKLSLSFVTARWAVPAVRCTNPHLVEYSSVWVGTNGVLADRHAHHSVQQGGTDSDCDGTTPVYLAWFQNTPSQKFAQLIPEPVRAGDRMLCQVTFGVVHGRHEYVVIVNDLTQGWTKTKTYVMPYGPRSAEVIVEAPNKDSHLADFNRIFISDVGTVRSSFAKAVALDMSGKYAHATVSKKHESNGSFSWVVTWHAR